jgi:hypothetical protein
MIKFIPKLVEHNSTIADGRKILSNKVNKALVAQLTEIFKDNYCQDHPNFENILLVNMQNEGQPIATIETFCCDSFKKNLELIANNKNPFKKI